MADSSNPGGKGFFDGFTGFFSRKFSLPKPEVPDREVRDMATVVWDKGPVQTHQQAASHPALQQEPMKSQSRKAHQYGYGYGTGALMAGVGFGMALSLVARRAPPLRPYGRALTITNALHSAFVFSQLPNQVNRRIQHTAPDVHATASEHLHTEAEKVRSRSGTK